MAEILPVRVEEPVPIVVERVPGLAVHEYLAIAGIFKIPLPLAKPLRMATLADVGRKKAVPVDQATSNDALVPCRFAVQDGPDMRVGEWDEAVEELDRFAIRHDMVIAVEQLIHSQVAVGQRRRDGSMNQIGAIARQPDEPAVGHFDAAVPDPVENGIRGGFKHVELVARFGKLRKVRGGGPGKAVQPLAQRIDMLRHMSAAALDIRTALIELENQRRHSFKRAGDRICARPGLPPAIGARMQVGDHPARALLQMVDRLGYLLGRLASAARKLLHLSRNRREAAGFGSRPRGFDRRVDCKDGRLPGNRTKIFRDGGDALDDFGKIGQLIAHLDDVLDQPSDLGERGKCAVMTVADECRRLFGHGPYFARGAVGLMLEHGELIHALVKHLQPAMIILNAIVNGGHKTSGFAATQRKRATLLAYIRQKPLFYRFMLQSAPLVLRSMPHFWCDAITIAHSR